ncbi:MAG: glycosylase [Eubacterium sp.]|nr:glycosylase [Eubacterium sp.]
MKHWLEESIFYEIYPQSFCDSNGDGIGDFAGIIGKLDYIRELGCNALWLNPCYLSPFGDAGYDVADYCQAAPRYGTNEDLVRLFEEVHKRDMHIILDLVPGHTSVDHPWFKESCEAEPNKYWGRYIWSDSIWVDVAGHVGIAGSLRGLYPRNGNVAVNFFSNQPALNYGFANVTEPWQSAVDSPEALATRQAMKDVMAFWLAKGCDGFRVDMAGSLVKNDPGSTETIRLWQDMRDFLDQSYPDAVLISEWGEPDKSLLGGFHMDFLLHFGPSHYLDLFRCEHPFFSREGKGDASVFVETYKKNYELTNKKGMICIPSGNHDMERLRKYLDCDEMKMVYAFLMSMPGVPFVYYGDEIGMRHLDLLSVEGGFDRTGARTPMQWEDGKNYGFSDAPAEKLYTAQDPAEDAPVVSQQMAEPASLWHEIQKLARVRRQYPALCASGEIEFVYCEPEKYPLVYLRSEGDSKILVVLNPSGKEVSCPCPYELGEVFYVLGNEVTITDGVLYIPGESAAFAAVKGEGGSR